MSGPPEPPSNWWGRHSCLAFRNRLLIPPPLQRWPAIRQQAQVAQFFLDPLRRWDRQGLRHLFQEQVGELFSGAVECLAHAGRGERSAELGAEPCRHLGGWQVRVVGPETQHCKRGPAGFLLRRRQQFPGAGEQFVAPAIGKLPVGSEYARRFDRRLLDLLRERARTGALAFLVIDDQVKESRLDEVAEAAARRIGPAKVAAQEAQGEFLAQFVGPVLVAQGAKQVTPDRAAIALPQLLPRRVHALGGTVVCSADDRPERGHLAEV